MESTLLTLLLNASNLKWWLADPSCPAVVVRCKAEFDQIYGSERVDDAEDTSDVEGRWDDEDESPTTQMPPVDLQPLLRSPLACVLGFICTVSYIPGTRHIQAIVKSSSTLEIIEVEKRSQGISNISTLRRDALSWPYNVFVS